MSLPDFVIIGAMKCGTSTLHEQLAAQSQFFMSRPKEPNFFSDDDVYARGMDWYRRLFADAPAGAIRGESSTHYTKLPTHPRTIERLADALPDAKFIYVMRDPVDRLVSHYIHEWSEGTIRTPIDEAITRSPELVDYGRYAYQLGPWIETFGRRPILPVFFERLTAERDAELKRIAGFLGADAASVAWVDEKSVANVSAHRIKRFPLYDIVVEHPIATAVRRAVVPRAIRSRVKANLRMSERPEIGATALAGLHAVFDEDLAELSAMIGVELNCASFRQKARATPAAWA